MLNADVAEAPLAGPMEPPSEAVAASVASLATALPSVPAPLVHSVNEMDVVTNRGSRSGSLSKFLDDADILRRRSITASSDEMLLAAAMHDNKLPLSSFLAMDIDPILEILDDPDSDMRHWLLQPDTVQAVLEHFVAPPTLAGKPHEEYGYYKDYFVCSEIIMKLYTGEEDLFESFSCVSSAESVATSTTAVFGCTDDADLAKWELLFSLFQRNMPLDEIQLLFFSKVRSITTSPWSFLAPF